MVSWILDNNFRQVLKLVLVVIATFFLCWSPQQLLMAHAIFSTEIQLTRSGLIISVFVCVFVSIFAIFYLF